VRLWLEAFDYPAIEGGGIHIAHVLFGGVILFLGAIVPLMFSNRWVYSLGAVLTGVGSGLFIDEIGKFLTSNNDYFYPPAMPLVYALFLGLVVLHLRFRKAQIKDARHELYEALDALQEVLDFDLERREFRSLKKKLREISEQTDNLEYKDLSDSLLRFIKKSSVEVVGDNFGFFEKFSKNVKNWFEEKLQRRIFRTFLILIFGISGFLSFWDLVSVGRSVLSYEYFVRLTSDVFIYNDLIGTQERAWFLIRLFLEGLVGIFLLNAARLFLRKKDKKAVETGEWGLIFSLVGVNLLLFYFDQIWAVLSVLWDYLLLILIIRYKERFVFRSFKRKITT
jgi:hypothetical protein